MFRTISKPVAAVLLITLLSGISAPLRSQDSSLVIAQQNPNGYGETVNYGSQSNNTNSNFNSSYSKGQIDAKLMNSSGGWFAGGVGAGLLLSLLGTTIVTVAADGDRPYQVPANTDQQAYMLGYYEQSKSSNKWAAFGGGCVGTAIFVGLILGSAK